jgi:hypothetical protein
VLVLALILVPLLLLLALLIFKISHGEHFAPQAYYRHKRTGAPVAFGLDALGPRPRRRLPQELEARAARAAEEARRDG